MFNIFRISADLAHLASILILVHNIRKTRQIDGISLKTQVLYVLVFCTRYLDLLTFRWRSVYNTLMKFVFIGSSVYVVSLIQKCRVTNPVAYRDMLVRDTFHIKYLLAGSAVLALIFNYKFTFLEIFWSFSVWLESFAIMPQLFMISRSGKASTITSHYIFAMGLYRALYIPNWIWRYSIDGRPLDKLSFCTGLIQTALYSDFFYVYYKKVVKGSGFQLPH
ncbi:ER lumen protein-retaining receptor [Lachancea thermotolerans]|uniref:KLTH0E01848p n=1 Tax=Lachancea thermotolerans (strain ATCC 56472 / CBS 6340 / NRRL Y-8284) TaxID=559295 RepID=C5DH71_LACTC|nr:KLTH0E01848p [Lachancea thermotolerans CBS 6340]CAR23132.1 KLTH0E01848p [Lachancea thermotolerans CBS 6340]